MYERKDASVPIIASVACGLILSILVAELALSRYFRALKKESTRPPSTDVALVNQRKAPPPPRLQADPVSDLNEYIEKEKVLLSTYGWVDRQKGIVRVPIQRAMETMIHENR